MRCRKGKGILRVVRFVSNQLNLFEQQQQLPSKSYFVCRSVKFSKIDFLSKVQTQLDVYFARAIFVVKENKNQVCFLLIVLKETKVHQNFFSFQAIHFFGNSKETVVTELPKNNQCKIIQLLPRTNTQNFYTRTFFLHMDTITWINRHSIRTVYPFLPFQM